MQPVQAPEEPESVVSSCGHVSPLEERFASWIGQQDRLFPSHEWLEDWSRARCDEMSQWAVLVTGPPGTGKTVAVRLLVSRVRGTFLECDMREVEGRKLVELILKGQGGLRQTSVAILNIDTDVTDELKWRLCKAAQQLQIPLIFVCDDGVVTARDELVQKCLRLEVRRGTTQRRAGVATNVAAERPQHAGGTPVHRNRAWTRRAQGYQHRAVAGTAFFK